MVLSEWNTRWKIVHALGNSVPNHLEAFKLEWQPAFGVLLQEIYLTVPLLCFTVMLLQFLCRSLPASVLSDYLKAAIFCLKDCDKVHCIQTVQDRGKFIPSHSGHTIETRSEFQTWACQPALTSCVSSSLETDLSIRVCRDALLNAGLSHGTAIKMLLLATYLLVPGQLKTCFIWLSKKSRGTSLFCVGEILLPAPFSPVDPPRSLGGGILLYLSTLF